MCTHKEFKLKGYVDLGHVGLDELDDMCESRIGNILRLSGRCDLLGILELAKAIDNGGSTALDLTALKSRLECLVTRKRDLCLLNSGNLSAAVLNDLCNNCRVTLIGGDNFKYTCSLGSLSRFDVAEVGDKNRTGCGDDYKTVLKVEAGDVSLVDLGCDDNGIKAFSAIAARSF